MFKLEIPKELYPKIFESCQVVYPVYKVTSGFAQLNSTYMKFPKPEVLEWMVETLGEYRYAFRKFDCPYVEKFHTYSDGVRMKEWDGISTEEWNRINPIIPAERRVWIVGDDYISFVTEGQAALFKLRWF